MCLLRALRIYAARLGRIEIQRTHERPAVACERQVFKYIHNMENIIIKTLFYVEGQRRTDSGRVKQMIYYERSLNDEDKKS